MLGGPMVQLPRYIRGTVTLGLVASYTYMILTSVEVPAEYFGLVALALGFYFKEI